MLLEPLPFVDNLESKPKNGFAEKKFRFCDLHFNSKCTDHYKKIYEKEGEYICPYGFTTVVKILNTKKKVFTSFELEGTINRKEIKRNKTNKDNKKKFTKQELNSLFEWYVDIDSNINAKQNILRDFDKHTFKVTQKEEVLDDTLHELRKLNNALKKQAFFLKSHLDQGNFNRYEIDQRSKNIFSTSQLISARLDAYDFTLNPSGIEASPKSKINIYKKFEKASHCLDLIMRERNINIVFNGSCRCLIDFYEIIDILPFIIFENAIKYSQDNSTIICEFDTKEQELNSIVVKNNAYLPLKSEIPKLIDKNFRGSSSQSISGSGKGLYIAKMICDYNGLDLSVLTFEESNIGGKPFGQFIVKISIAAANIKHI
jgi:signal transduction histidine kinase